MKIKKTADELISDDLTTLPIVRAENEYLKKIIKMQTEVLKTIDEWGYHCDSFGQQWHSCPSCHAIKEDGHHKNCKLFKIFTVLQKDKPRGKL